MLTLVGHAYEERGEPFIVAVEIIEALMRVLPDAALRQVLGDSAAEVARLVPRLRDRLPDIPSPVELAPEQRQRYLYNALLDFTRRLSNTVPSVILLDDLHWADESSMNLLEHIAPNISDLPLLYVVTYRDIASDMGPPFRRARPRSAPPASRPRRTPSPGSGARRGRRSRACGARRSAARGA